MKIYILSIFHSSLGSGANIRDLQLSCVALLQVEKPRAFGLILIMCYGICAKSIPVTSTSKRLRISLFERLQNAFCILIHSISIC